jgi:molybdopterin biosynthesis enzyme
MFHLLARPVIQALAGKPKAQAAAVLVILISRLFSVKDRRNFTMIQLKHDAQDRLVVEPVESVASDAITTLPMT